jgi:hypothetical protein
VDRINSYDCVCDFGRNGSSCEPISNEG